MSVMIGLAVAAALAGDVTIADLTGVTDISGLAVSPDGRLVAFRTERPSSATNEVETQWFVAPVDGRKAPRVRAVGGPALFNGAGVVVEETPRWLPDGRAFLVRRAGRDGVQVWRIGATSGNVAQITHAAGDVRAYEVSADGAEIDYATGPARAAVRAAATRLRDQGGRIDSSVDLSIGVVGGARVRGQSQSVRLTGDWFDRRGLLDDGPVRAWHQPLGGGRPISGRIAPRWADYVLPDEDAKKAACTRVDCTAMRINAIVAVPALRSNLVTTSDTGQRQTLRLVSATSVRAIVVAPGLLSGSRTQTQPCVIAQSRAVCVAASADLPPRLVSIELSNAAVTTLYAPNRNLERRTAGTAQRLTWSDEHGHKFIGQLIVPKVAPPRGGFPLVVQYYWCDGFLRGGAGDELPMFPLATHGIAVLCINKPPVQGTGQDSVADYELAASGVSAAIELLAGRQQINRDLVGMQGLSFGSQVTMWIASETPLLRAAQIASGQFEPTSYWYEALPGRDIADRMREGWGLDDPDRFPARWQAIAPAKRVDRIHAALLMLLPESEARWSIELYAKLAKSTTPVELYAFPDAAHIKSAPRQKAADYERTLAWFLFWLKGELLPSPGDPGRRARWTALAARRDAAQASEASQSSASTNSSKRM